MQLSESQFILQSIFLFTLFTCSKWVWMIFVVSLFNYEVFWYFIVLLAVVKSLSNTFWYSPYCYTLNCIICYSKFGQFSCTFPINHTVWVCSHGIWSCKSAGQIFNMGEHEKPAHNFFKPKFEEQFFVDLHVL